jgi:hypothetical protein
MALLKYFKKCSIFFKLIFPLHTFVNKNWAGASGAENNRKPLTQNTTEHRLRIFGLS